MNDMALNGGTTVSRMNMSHFFQHSKNSFKGCKGLTTRPIPKMLKQPIKIK